MKHIIVALTFLLISTSTMAQHGLRAAAVTDKNGKCASCIEAVQHRPNEINWHFQERGGQIFFVISDKAYIDTLFPTDVHGIAADIILRSQFDCEKKSDYGKSNISKGQLLEPVYAKSFKKNIISENGGAAFLVGNLPAEVKGQTYEINMVFINDGTVCQYNKFFGIKAAGWQLLEMGLYMDTMKTKITPGVSTVTFVDHQKELRFIIPFEKNKSNYAPEDIRPLFDSLRLTDYHITSIDIHAYASVEGTTENNLKLQKGRATSIVNALTSFQKEGIQTTVTSSENWVEFIEDMKKEGKTDLANMTQVQIKQKLNSEGLAKQLEQYLKKHRKAVVTMELTKRTRHEEKNNETITSTYRESIINKDIAAAIEAQQEMFARIKDARMPESLLTETKIPNEVAYGSLLSNAIVFSYQQGADIKGTLAGFEALAEKMPTNMSIQYNIIALQLISWAQGNMLMKHRALKTKILDLRKAEFESELTERLMLNYHIVRSEYAMSIKDYELKNKSVNYLKGKYRRAQRDDEDMIRVAKYLVFYNRLDWAEMILYPHAKRIDVDNELLFYYLNLTIANPEHTTEEKYRSIILNAINKDKDRFCHLFKDYQSNGVTFQLLEDKYLKEMYCETCNE